MINSPASLFAPRTTREKRKNSGRMGNINVAGERGEEGQRAKGKRKTQPKCSANMEYCTVLNGKIMFPAMTRHCFVLARFLES